jgi:hypothetical protein
MTAEKKKHSSPYLFIIILPNIYHVILADIIDEKICQQIILILRFNFKDFIDV